MRIVSWVVVVSFDDAEASVSVSVRLALHEQRENGALGLVEESACDRVGAAAAVRVPCREGDEKRGGGADRRASVGCACIDRPATPAEAANAAAHDRVRILIGRALFGS